MPRAAELFRAVRAAARGEAVLSPGVAARLVGRVRGRRRPMPLSQREREVLGLIARGASNKDWAGGCSSAKRRSRPTWPIYAKLGVNDRAAAVAKALDRGLLVPRKQG